MFFKKYLLNKYFITGLAFVIWMIFFDEEDMISQAKLSKNLHGLERQKSYYQKEIKNIKNSIYILEHDTAHLEKYAREKYFMKKDNEDVFVIIDDDKDGN